MPSRNELSIDQLGEVSAPPLRDAVRPNKISISQRWSFGLRGVNTLLCVDGRVFNLNKRIPNPADREQVIAAAKRHIEHNNAKDGPAIEKDHKEMQTGNHSDILGHGL